MAFLVFRELSAELLSPSLSLICPLDLKLTPAVVIWSLTQNVAPDLGMRLFTPVRAGPGDGGRAGGDVGVYLSPLTENQNHPWICWLGLGTAPGPLMLPLTGAGPARGTDQHGLGAEVA